MKTFIKVTEIWRPSPDRARLEFSAGLYGELSEFKAVSEKKTFAFDEGLPGKAWAAGHPLILTEFDNSYFKRTQIAKKAGLTCGIAIPIFAGEFLTAVVVFLCGDDEHHAGAIEVWSNIETESNALRVTDGYYGSLTEFEKTSKSLTMMKGYGLPGEVWQRGMPILIEDMGSSSTFVRADDAKKTGISTALAIPVSVISGRVYIMSFLSAKATPIARRLQIWIPDEQRQHLICQAGYSKQGDNLAELFEAVVIPKGEGVLGRVWLTGVPVISGAPNQAHIDGRLSAMLTIPVIENGNLKAIVTFLF
ncbi:MAG: GAF domain-containing protein [Methylobacter sp.]|nr:MAG: GAF domain-containing protein [Methylobacter sp.]PPD04773.1 MAG: GAF domain-containing protein [Methylobacter sp.]PPD23656.1 MAG: GAF domain-containing protein [Methylobacter sp.]